VSSNYTINLERIKESDQSDMIAMYWNMLRIAEDAADRSLDVADRMEVEAGYRLWNRVTGYNKKPMWKM
jgi:hypothetical protein